MKITLFFFFIASSICLYAQPGSLDLTFGNNGIAATHVGICDKGYCIASAAEGKIVIAGSFRTDSTSFRKDIVLIRYNEDGTLDSTFDFDGIVTSDLGNFDEANSVLILPDGKIVLAGYTDNWGIYTDAVLMRYNQNGTLDNTFGTNGIDEISFANADDKILSSTLQSNGEIVVAGTLFNGHDDDYFVARFSSDGSLDQSFGSNGFVQVDYDNFNQEGESAVVQEDGKIVVGGYSYESSTANFMVARFTSSGTPDLEFGTDGVAFTDLGGDDHSRAVVIQPDGKILITGTTFQDYGTDVALVRYNADGTLDNSFGTSGITVANVAGLEDDSRSIALQSDGKILISGSSRFSLTTEATLLRYNPNGTIDSTFDGDGVVANDFGGSAAYALASTLQDKNKILLAGVSDLSIAVARYQLEISLNVVDFSEEKSIAVVYPNPITSQALLEYELVNDQTLTISLYDLNGKVVQNFYSNQKKFKGIHQEVLNINKSLSPGNYFLSISNGLKRIQVQIEKQ